MAAKPPTLRYQRAHPVLRYDSPADADRERQARRGMHTGSAEWRAIRARKLKRDPLCEDHLERKEIRAAREVDHVDGNTSNTADENLRSLCKPCHSRKTARENRGPGGRFRTWGRGRS